MHQRFVKHVETKQSEGQPTKTSKDFESFGRCCQPVSCLSRCNCVDRVRCDSDGREECSQEKHLEYWVSILNSHKTGQSSQKEHQSFSVG